MFGWTPGQVVDALTALAASLTALATLVKQIEAAAILRAIHTNTSPSPAEGKS